jgi:hypothetical protein
MDASRAGYHPSNQLLSTNPIRAPVNISQAELIRRKIRMAVLSSAVPLVKNIDYRGSAELQRYRDHQPDDTDVDAVKKCARDSRAPDSGDYS